MKLIYYTKGDSIIIDKWTITNNGIPFTTEMEQHDTIKNFLTKGLLNIKEVEESKKETKEEVKTDSNGFIKYNTSNNIEIVTSPEAIITDSPKVSEVSEIVVPSANSQSFVNIENQLNPVVQSLEPQTNQPVIEKESNPINQDIPTSTPSEIKQNNNSIIINSDKEPEVITEDKNNVGYNTTKPISEVMAEDLQKLTKELEEISKKQEIVIPEKKN